MAGELPGTGWSHGTDGSSGEHPRGRAPWPRWLLLVTAIMSLAAFALLLRSFQWPAPIVLELRNEGPDSVLVDARWLDLSSGIDGPLVRVLPARQSTTLLRWRRDDICVRVIDPATGRVASGLLTLAAVDDGDTLRVSVRGSTGAPPLPQLPDSCPPDLADHRVRVAPGRYFDPGNPEQIRREPLIRLY